MAFSTEGPVSILAIAPYDTMATSLEYAAESFPGIRLDARVGDLEEGVDILNGLNMGDYDAVLSRGGTAELIREVTDLPVVEIPVSVYDILRAIKLSENYTDSCAIVGFPGVAENAYTLCNLLRLKIPIETVQESGEVDPVLDRLQEQGIRTVICDMVTYRLARQRGFNTLLLTSGENSIQEALRTVEQQARAYRGLWNEILLLRAMQSVDANQCVVFHENGEQVTASGSSVRDDVVREMRRRLPEVPETGPMMFYHYDIGGKLHTVTATRLNVQGRRYVCFRDQPRQIPLRTARPGIRFYDRAECEHLLADSFFSLGGAIGEMDQKLTSFAAGRHSIMILGEEGTGREQIARALYLRSHMKNNPLIVLDGAQLNDRSWDYLLKSDTSPLCDAGITVLVKHTGDIPPARRAELITLIEETALDQRLWLLFSCDVGAGQNLSDFAGMLSGRLAPLTLDLPTLRSRRDEIPALSSVYLNNLNMELGKQLAGFEPEAMTLLMGYDWPGNYTQFKHVLKELALAVSQPYISSSDVADILARERRLHRQPSSSADFSVFDGTLEEINGQIVRQVLNVCGGNQSMAAKRLNISRTTLWRIMNKLEM